MHDVKDCHEGQFPFAQSARSLKTFASSVLHLLHPAVPNHPRHRLRRLRPSSSVSCGRKSFSTRAAKNIIQLDHQPADISQQEASNSRSSGTLYMSTTDDLEVCTWIQIHCRGRYRGQHCRRVLTPFRFTNCGRNCEPNRANVVPLRSRRRLCRICRYPTPRYTP